MDLHSASSVQVYERGLVGGSMKFRVLPLAGLSLLMGCSEAETESPARAIIAQVEPTNSDEAAPQNSFGFMEAMEQGPDLFGERVPPARMLTVDVSDNGTGTPEPAAQQQDSAPQPQIAYSYGYGFQISSERIADLQRAHAAMCEAMGPKCRILRTSLANSDGWDGFGEIRLEIVATEAGVFGTKLAEPAEELGGELVSSVRDGEDLSETIIDTEARLQSRLVLRQKLTGILQNNRGSVAELIAAEKALADVNQQIDSTRSKLEQHRNRIRYSDIRIEYEPYFGQSQLGFGRPVMTALRSIGTTLGTTVAALIYLITALVPITLLILAIRWVLHRFGLRIRFWRRNSARLESES